MLKPKNLTRYKTRNGSIAEIYKIKASNFYESTIYGEAIGAVLYNQGPISAACGWEAAQWDGERGYSIQGPHFDLVEEMGPIIKKIDYGNGCLKYIRKMYCVPAYKDVIVSVFGKTGIITGGRDGYVMVIFDGNNYSTPCHPEELEYHIETQKVIIIN